ncbi:MAG: hypothetical protein HC811_05080 [Flammeovirgaceae bacterium]|nr:hypothetical protein [Flammeovirgaceae bacterium]
MKENRTEYYYRKARLAHKTSEIEAAKLFYQQTIDIALDNPWYFAPNSALQLGYIAEEQNNSAQAKVYFEKALSYKNTNTKTALMEKQSQRWRDLVRN